MTPANGIETISENGNKHESAEKEWRPPVLRKLPIAATAGGAKDGNEGNTTKSGKANLLS